MDTLAPGSLLAQVRPANTTAATAVTASVSNTEITAIHVCNTSGAVRKARIFHDNDGSTYDETTALYWDVAVPADSTLEINNESGMSGIVLLKDGTLGVRTDSANGLTFSIYGLVSRQR